MCIAWRFNAVGKLERQMMLIKYKALYKSSERKW